jgi:arginase
VKTDFVVTAYLGVPYNSDPAPGVDKAPAVLRDAGLLEGLGGLADAGDLTLARDPNESRDPETGYLAPRSLLAASQTIRRRVEQLLAAAERPLLIGGDCALLMGVFAALRDHGERTGLVFIDGHVDFYDPKQSPTGEAADSELAVLAGRGPRGFIDLAGPPPLVDPADVVVLGFRDQADWATFGAVDPTILEPQLRLLDLDELRRRGLEQTGRDMARSLAQGPGRFWLHLDLDVLSTAALPAVDYPMEGGLDWYELMQLTRPLAISPALVGIDVTIYNPELDPNRVYAPRIVRFLSDLLTVGSAGVAVQSQKPG